MFSDRTPRSCVGLLLLTLTLGITQVSGSEALKPSPFLWTRVDAVLSSGASQDILMKREVAPGLEHEFEFRSRNGPLCLNRFRLDLTSPELQLVLGKADDTLLGQESVPRIVQRHESSGETVLTAINGGYWDEEDLPVGICFGGGFVYRLASHRWTFLLGGGGTTFIGHAAMQGLIHVDGTTETLTGVNLSQPVEGFVLYTPQFGWQTPHYSAEAVECVLSSSSEGILPNRPTPVVVTSLGSSGGGTRLGSTLCILAALGRDAAAKASAWEAGTSLTVQLGISALEGDLILGLSAGPKLIEQGRIVATPERLAQWGFHNRRTARTALGVTSDGRRLLLLTVDGSPSPHSRGMTLGEVAAELQRMGAKEAINLDGGSSTTAWVQGRSANRPSHPFGLKPVSNALMVVRRRML